MTANGVATGTEGTSAAMSTSTTMGTTDATSGAETSTPGEIADLVAACSDRSVPSLLVWRWAR
jgi:hypothetical protein